MNDAQRLVSSMQLLPHPEGGYYRETYRSSDRVSGIDRFKGTRHVSTAILYLLEAGDFSAFHRIRSDEIWHFYTGDPLQIDIIDAQGHHQVTQLSAVGPYQFCVPFGCWFAAHLCHRTGFCLVGCTVSPGFDFSDFEMGTCSQLTRLFPQHEPLIKKFTRH